MLNFIPDNTAMSDPIFNPQEIPKEMDIFYKNENDFLPPGKTFKDLTPEEQRVLQNQYRFSPLRPGIYQGITGISKGNNSASP